MVIELKEPDREPERKKMQANNKAMLCPHCQVPLGMSDRQGIEIDFCPQCRGVWLDRGELDKIIERSAAEMPNSPMSQNRDYSGKDDRDYSGHGRKNSGHHGRHGRYGGRRKSWLHELFD